MWASWNFNSPPLANCLFNIFLWSLTSYQTSNLWLTGPLWAENTGWGWIPLTMRQWCGKCGHVMMVHAHDDVMKWKHFLHNWALVRGIHRSPVNSPHKGQWRGALRFSLICARTNGWVNNQDFGDLRRHHAHYDVTVMGSAYVMLSTHYAVDNAMVLAECCHHRNGLTIAQMLIDNLLSANAFWGLEFLLAVPVKGLD